MALVQLTFESKALHRQTTINVVLPMDKYYKNRDNYVEHPLKTLYLLHGYNGNFTDWNNNTRVQRWAVERNLVLVMPSGDNSFYVDKQGADYGKFIGEELVEVTRRFFHLSRNREDTFIGGFSMGGYGALRNGMKYADTFSHVICLSSACGMFDKIGAEKYGSGMTSEDDFMLSLEQFKDTDRNPDVLIADLVERKKNDHDFTLPRFYVSCGLQDGLIEDNRRFRDKLVKAGFDVTYYEGEGGHEWFFWDREIKKIFDDFLPLEKNYNEIFY